MSGKAKRQRLLLREEEEESRYTPSLQGLGVVTEGTNTRDFLSLEDKLVFNSVKKPIDRSRFNTLYERTNNKIFEFLTLFSNLYPEKIEGAVKDTQGAANRQPDLSKFRCLPTENTFRTIPDSNKYKNNKNSCPTFTNHDSNTGCCILRDQNIFDMRGYDEGREFLSALYYSIGHVRNRDVAQKTFGADFMDWYSTTTSTSMTSNTLTFNNGARFRDVFLQFLFRANPTMDVKLDLDKPLKPVVNGLLQIFSAAESSWVVTNEQQDIVNLMRKAGVDGKVTYTYTSTPPTQLLHMKCSSMIHVADFIDVNKVPELFASEECGFNGKKDIHVEAIGIIPRNVSFYDFLFRLITSMPDFNCKFSMLVDDGTVAQGWRDVDFLYTRVLPLHYCFSSTVGPDIDDVMERILSLLGEELPFNHGPYIPVRPMATGGVVGEWSEELYENGNRNKGRYFFKLKLSSSTGKNVFSVKKKRRIPLDNRRVVS